MPTEIDRRRWRYFGHAMRHKGPLKKAYEAYQEAKKRGRQIPKMKLAVVIKKDPKELGFCNFINLLLSSDI